MMALFFICVSENDYIQDYGDDIHSYFSDVIKHYLYFFPAKSSSF